MSATTPTAIGSYTAAEVARLAGVSPRRIGSWAREGIILPSVSHRPNVYSYADAGEAIVAHYLVEQGKLPAEIKKAVHQLREQYGDWPLAHAPLAHDGAMLLEWDSDEAAWISVDIPDQEIIEQTLIDLKSIRESLGRGGWVALESPRTHIEVNPERHSGTPVVRGRRLPTSLVAGIASGDGGRETLREDYGLSDSEIDDAVGYEADVARLAAA
jgi:uncharacterized protein (DUF433 family)/DNA-binding transcriptional MerR regulator